MTSLSSTLFYLRNRGLIHALISTAITERRQFLHRTVGGIAAKPCGSKLLTTRPRLREKGKQAQRRFNVSLTIIVSVLARTASHTGKYIRGMRITNTSRSGPSCQRRLPGRQSLERAICPQY